jgi:hypothetical protein
MSLETNRPYGSKGPGPHGESYEHTDADVGLILKWAIGLALVLVFSFLSVWWLFDFMAKEMPMGRPAWQFAAVRPLPPGPRLQAEPRRDLEHYCAAEENLLNSYGWEDQSVGTVRIPIDRAMDVLIDRGLPARTPAEVTAAAAASELPPDFDAVPPTRDFQGQCGYTLEDMPKESDTSPKE